MLNEEIFIKSSFRSFETCTIFRKLLVTRTILEQGEDEQMQKKMDFSDLIEDVIETKGLQSAKCLLEVGFESLPSQDDKALVAQALSRLLMEDFADAEKWAEEALHLQPNNFTMHDTKGQVYKRKLRYNLIIKMGFHTRDLNKRLLKWVPH